MQLGVKYFQSTRHDQRLICGVNGDDTLLTERHGAIVGEVLHHVVGVSPDLADLKVSLAVDRDDPLRFCLGYFKPKRL